MDTGTNTNDPLNLDNLRLPQNYLETCGVKKVIVTVPVRKPEKQEFVRVHPDPHYRENLPILEVKADREQYVVAANLVADLTGEIAFKTVFAAINREGKPFLWPVPLPSADGRDNEWNHSQRGGAEKAMQKWIRLSSNMAIGQYEIKEATATLPEPDWPELSFQEIIRLAFADRVITSLDHPVVKRLRGFA
jgi:hypothetical protein